MNKAITIFFIILIAIMYVSLVTAQSDKKEEDRQTKVNSDKLTVDSTKLTEAGEQWQAVSQITNYMKSQGLKRINANVDTLLNLVSEKRKKVIVRYVNVYVPVYVPIGDSMSYMELTNEAKSDYYVDTIIKKKGIINKILHPKQR